MQSTHTRRSRASSSRGRRRTFSSDSRHRSHNAGGPRRGHTGGGGRRAPRKRAQPTFDPSQFINKNPVEVAPEVYVPTHTFHDFGLETELVDVVHASGMTVPSPIQDKIIEPILQGKDVVGLAETGTGKTAAFLLPLLQRVKKKPQHQTLILTPTRELALQVEAELRKLGSVLGVRSTICVGGMNIRPQIRNLQRKNQFVIGTPGRVLDLIKRGDLQAGNMSAVVLDEADRMLDMGFINDMREILGATPNNRQTLFFSATMDDKTKALVHDFMHSPEIISVKKKDVTNSIQQDVVPFVQRNKYDTLLSLLKDAQEFKRVIVFGSMKHSVEKLGRELSRSGIPAESIHGNKNHAQRQRSLSRFKSGQVRVLVATDVAARGIHVDGVSHVINYDLPNTFEDYVHRIGRTGRGEKKGAALTFVSQS